MKTDKLTKLLLGVIAINLSYQTLKELKIIPSVYAENPNYEMIPTANYGLVPLNDDGSINVNLNNTEAIDVNIRDINTYDELNVAIKSVNTTDELYVNIDEVGGRGVYGGTIEVEIKD